MSSNETNKNCTSYPEFKFPISRSLNNRLLEEIPSLTPQKDIFLHIKPQMNLNNFLLNMNTSNISPNKYSFDPRLFINDYNSGKKSNNSGFAQEKINLLFFNSTKKEKEEKKFVGKKRKFKYILSSEKKINKIKNINIKQISLHGHRLLNINLIQDNNEYNIKNISFPRKLLKFLKKKFPYFKISSNKISNNSPKKEYNLDKINILTNELEENNLYYFPGEINCEIILKKYCEEMQNSLEKIKNNYINKKNLIYTTKNILLLELLIRNFNSFTNYINKKYIQNNQDNSPINKLILFSTKQSLPLPNKNFLENLAENNASTTKKINIEDNTTSINKQRTTIFKAKIPMSNAYKCDFCERVFKNGQALGGHISQSHPKQSYKYKQKIEIRNSRTDRRELLYEARRRLFKAYNIDLDYLLKNKRKNEIKNFIKVHKVEYKKELNSLKNYSNNINHINNILNKPNVTDKNNYENNSDIDIEINSSSKDKGDENANDNDNDRNKL